MTEQSQIRIHPRDKGVCILLPVLNEACNIGELVHRIRAAMAGREYVICFVDDGSRDGTVDRIRDCMKESDHRMHLIERTKRIRGSQRGSALFTAMMWALDSTHCDTIIEMDGDLSHRPEELVHGLAILDSGFADVVIASKYLPGSKVTNRPVGRRLVSNVCNIAVRLLISTRISELLERIQIVFPPGGNGGCRNEDRVR
jgi:dolichol-phosphate mannosyltransferase